MTCIVGIEHAGRVTIGGDSAGISGLDITIRADTKVFRTGAYVMGFTTSYRMGQILRYRLNPRKPDGRNVDRFMATAFVDSVRKCLKEYGWMGEDDHRDSGGTFLVGVGGHLYAIHSDFQIERAADGYNAVGCGQGLALGSLHTTSELDMEADDRVARALTAAAHHSAGVCAPYIIEETRA